MVGNFNGSTMSNLTHRLRTPLDLWRFPTYIFSMLLYWLSDSPSQLVGTKFLAAPRFSLVAFQALEVFKEWYELFARWKILRTRLRVSLQVLTSDTGVAILVARFWFSISSNGLVNSGTEHLFSPWRTYVGASRGGVDSPTRGLHSLP